LATLINAGTLPSSLSWLSANTAFFRTSGAGSFRAPEDDGRRARVAFWGRQNTALLIHGSWSLASDDGASNAPGCRFCETPKTAALRPRSWDRAEDALQRGQAVRAARVASQKVTCDARHRADFSDQPIETRVRPGSAWRRWR
jgi:hypothetical protein